jgi:hypothetical protein
VGLSFFLNRESIRLVKGAKRRDKPIRVWAKEKNIPKNTEILSPKLERKPDVCANLQSKFGRE